MEAERAFTRRLARLFGSECGYNKTIADASRQQLSKVRTQARQNDGFALLIVLWVLVLISFLTAQVTATGRTDLRIAGNIMNNAIAQTAADGAIYESIFHLLDQRNEHHWIIGGGSHDLVIGETKVVVRLEDEAWRINPSTASPELLEALLRAIGAGSDSAPLARAISEWVGSAPVARTKAAVLAEYQAAGLDYGPPGAPLETLDELRSVLGIKPETFAQLSPHLTLFGPPTPSKASPDQVIAAAINDPSVKNIGPSAFDAPPDVLTVRMIVTAYGPGEALATRVAILRVSDLFPSGYQMLAWGTEILGQH